MITSELKNKVVEYIENDISLEEFENWYVPRIRSYLVDPKSDEAELIASIELELVHLKDGIINEDELRANLSEALKHVSIIEMITFFHIDENSEDEKDYITWDETSSLSVTQSQPDFKYETFAEVG